MSSDKFSFLNTFHIKEIESLYEKYKINPKSVEPTWSAFFHGFDFRGKEKKNHSNDIKKNEKFNLFSDIIEKEFLVLNLIQYFKNKGHFFSKKNPIIKNELPNPSIKDFGLSNKEMNHIFHSGNFLNIGKNSLKNIIHFLEEIYCKNIGIEYMYILDQKKIQWIEKWFQKEKNKKFSSNKKIKILKNLNKTISFEKFLHLKFPGKKRFSIEGNESLLLAIEDLIEFSSNKYSTSNFIIGMAHRGRLNVLSNILKKDYSKIFNEFQKKKFQEKLFSGDVKYHLGYSQLKKNKEGKNIEIYLVPNPSHLESVNPIVEGIARAQIDIFYTKNSKKVIPILIHGDASLSGQGIVYEVLQFSKLKGYKTGGTIHIVINNQIGFTTNPNEYRSSVYCTDIAKIIQSPVLHVNANDVESVIKSIYFAIDFRMRYHEDVFIDLIGYRKYGHNEGDEPRFTNPIIYKIISNIKNCYDLYKSKLIKEKIINNKEIEFIENKQNQILDQKYQESKNIPWKTIDPFLNHKKWINFPIVFNEKFIFKKINTKFSIQKIIEISKQIFSIPNEKKFLKKTQSIFKRRLEMIDQNIVDWSMAELLSYATLLYEGFYIRLSGEDVARGTFSQRHIVIKTEKEEEFLILNRKYNQNKGKIEVYNSPLSEYGVLGFEYGYSMVSPNVLNLWEAQFGDFSNGGQIIIDQYISSGEKKWKIKNGIVLLLPHGYEGQGPEHSSARIERYLQLCANNNLFVTNCTTPSNFYHLLRRQMKMKIRKPLIIFTPKSLLRNNQCYSYLKDLSDGSFQEILDDPTIKNPEKVEKIIFCSGKIYYELYNKKMSLKKKEKIVLIRIEQIYPLNVEKIKKILNKYSNNKKTIWIQEEPENMGLWNFLVKKLKNIISLNLLSPPECSSPSSGSYIDFLISHNKLLEKAFI